VSGNLLGVLGEIKSDTGIMAKREAIEYLENRLSNLQQERYRLEQQILREAGVDPARYHVAKSFGVPYNSFSPAPWPFSPLTKRSPLATKPSPLPTPKAVGCSPVIGYVFGVLGFATVAAAVLNGSRDWSFLVPPLLISVLVLALARPLSDSVNRWFARQDAKVEARAARRYAEAQAREQAEAQAREQAEAQERLLDEAVRKATEKYDQEIESTNARIAELYAEIDRLAMEEL
jgi:hypothetical protein